MNNKNQKPTLLFFARAYQTEFFPQLKSEHYQSKFVALTRKDKKMLKKSNEDVIFCFEDFLIKNFDNTSENNYELITSFYSDRFWGKYSHDVRNKLLDCQFEFWNDVLDYYKPQAVVNEVVAVENAETLYIISNKKNIEYWGWIPSPFEKKQFYWLDTPFNSSLSSNVFNCEIEDECYVFSKAYLEKINNNYQKPYWAQDIKNRFNFINILSCLISPIKNFSRYILHYNQTIKYLDYFVHYSSKTTLINSITRLKRLIKSILFFSYYDNPDIINNKEIFIYPMHYEPEATISYFTEFYQEQEALIINICKLLNKNQILFVKEHPQQPGALLDNKYRILKNKISNLYFIKSEYPTNDLIKKSYCILTQTSNLGWESLMLNKSVIVFGNVFYDKHPSIIKFDGNWENLREKVRKRDLNVPTYKQNLNFVAHIWNYCQEGNPFGHNKKLYHKKNIDNIISSIEKRVNTTSQNII